jgi:hypothetical protein
MDLDQMQMMRNRAVDAIRDHMLNEPQDVREYLHALALQEAYNGDEEAFEVDSNTVGDEHPSSVLSSCRYYLYYEVYSNENQRLAYEALSPARPQ